MEDLSFAKSVEKPAPVHRIKIRKGHSLWRFNPLTFECKRCVIDDKFVMESKYLYIPALNEKNVILRFLKTYKKKWNKDNPDKQIY